MRILCFDTETTGLGPDDEIVQLSIADAITERPILNEYFRPSDYMMERGWPEAAEITGITPEMVENCRSLEDEDVFDEIQAIFDSADILVGYHVIYDVHMIEKVGFDVSDKIFNDPMYGFSAYYWHCNPGQKYKTSKGKIMDPWMPWKQNGFGGKGQWISRNLSLAAETLCNKTNFGAHDSMNDVLATIKVWKKLNEMQEDAEAAGWATDVHGNIFYDINGYECLMDDNGDPYVDPEGKAMLFVCDYTLDQLEIIDARR